MSTTTDTGNPFPSMPNISFSTTGIQQVLCNLQVNKASGPDHIPSYILKHCSEEISPVLKILFTESVTRGELPTDFIHHQQNERGRREHQYLSHIHQTRLALVELKHHKLLSQQ